MNRVTLAILCLIVGAAIGYLIGRVTAPESGPAGVFEVVDGEWDDVGREADEQLRGEEPAARPRGRPAPPEEEAAPRRIDSPPDGAPRLHVASLRFFDRDGGTLGECLAPWVDSGARGAVFVFAQGPLHGAHSALADVGDASFDLERVVSRAGPSGLASVSTAFAEPPVAVVTSSPADGARVWLVESRDTTRRRPVEVVRRTWDPAAAADVLVLDTKTVAREGAVVVDGDGVVCGVVPPRQQRPVDRVWALPVTAGALSEQGRVDLDLAAFTQTYFEGTAEDMIRRGLKLLEQRRFLEAVEAFRRALDIDRAVWDRVREPMHVAWEGAIARLRGAAPDTVIATVRDALRDFPEDIEFLVLLASTAERGRLWRDALRAWEDAWRVDAARVGDLIVKKISVYRAWIDALLAAGERSSALAVLEEALTLSRDPDLLVQYGELLLRERAYGDAAAVWREAVGIDALLAGRLNERITRAERFAAGPGKVVIDYEPGARAIHAEVMINNRAKGTFIVDTGATSTWVPDVVARQARLDTGPNVPQVRVRTAGGERILPYSPADSVSIGSLAVKDIRVIVGDLPGTANRGLLGMDYLGRFGFENDSENGRFVIYTK